MDAALKLAERVIAYKNVRFILEHQNDSLDQLSAYLAKCMDELGHAPAKCEVIGGDFIELRFGSWAKALGSIGVENGGRLSTPSVENTKLFRDEYERQRAADKHAKREKKAANKELLRQAKAAKRAAQTSASNEAQKGGQ